MKLDDALLGRWPGLRSHPNLWARHLRDELQHLGRGVSEALLEPHPPAKMLEALIEAEEWEAAALFLTDEIGTKGLSPEELRQWEEQLRRARAASIAKLRAQWDDISQQAEALELPAAQEPLWGERGAVVRLAIERRAEEVSAEQARRASALHERVRGLSEAETTLREEVGALISAGALKEAEQLIEGTRASAQSPLPSPPVWPYRGPSDLRTWLAWYFDEEPRPMAFDRFGPQPTDNAAWRLLEALYRPVRDEGEVILRCIGKLMGAEAIGLVRRVDGWHGRFVGLADTGLSALGAARWPDGVAVWLPADPTAPPPRLSPDELVIRLAMEEHVPTAPGQLVLRPSQLLGALGLAPEERRRRLLAALGAEIPLDRLFERVVADASTAWPVFEAIEKKLLREERQDQRPVLVSAPPGIGKTVLLQRLAQATGASVIGPSTELPEVGTVLIDCARGLDAPAARRLVQAIHWIATQDVHPPLVVVSARPETAIVLERVRSGFFRREPLEALCHADARRSAQIQLAWGGVRTESPWLFDRLASLSAGNPQALAHLCEALTRVMFSMDPHQRTFTEEHVAKAWSDTSLRVALRALCWDPLADRAEIRAVARAIVECGDDAGQLTRADLRWAVDKLYDTPLEGAALTDAVALLQAYGFVEASADSVTLRRVGPALLLPSWVQG